MDNNNFDGRNRNGGPNGRSKSNGRGDNGKSLAYRPYGWRGRGRARGSGASKNSYNHSPKTTYAADSAGNSNVSSWGESQENTIRMTDGSLASEFYENTGYETTLCDAPSPPPRKQLKIDSVIASEMRKIYPGLLMYFPSALSHIVNIRDKISVAMNFLDHHQLIPTEKAAQAVKRNEGFDISYEHTMNDEEFVEGWPSFQPDLLENADDVLSVWGLSIHTLVHNILAEKNNSSDQNSFSEESSVPYIQARLMKLTPITPFKSIRSTSLGKFITIRGTVIRMGNVKPYCTLMTLRCTECLKKFVFEQIEGRYTFPARCHTPECKGKIFEALEADRTTQFALERIIRFQDVQHENMDRGSVPRSIDCRLGHTMRSICNAGDVLTICGVVKFHHESGGGFAAPDQQLHNFYIDVVAVRNLKDCDRTMGGNSLTFTNKDYCAVKEICDSGNLFRLLVASLCPTIFGHDLVKAGLLLCLFGGTPSVKESTISRRSDINVLIVGDPGIGKSQMLNVVCEVAPRGVYVCGTATTVAGLTVTLVKDGDDYSLEAGALVMADRGVCCIDEFDKMQAQHHALLEAMEQQSISVAKSGIFRTLPARASVIAAANPVGGHYNAARSVSENIRINPALLSRFDLIFILVDKSDDETDLNIVNHILGKRFPHVKRSHSQVSSPINRVLDSSYSLRDKLKFGTNDEADLIPHHLLRKYIAYARQSISPALSPEAADIIKKYYLDLRMKHRTVDTTPVTTRQLESLLRLTQARAKLELREIATEDDAKDVLEIFEFGMAGIFDDDLIVSTALSQLSGSTNGTSTGPKKSHTRGMAKKLLSTLQGVSTQQSKNIFTMDEIKQIARALGIGTGVETLVSALNTEGFLLNKGCKVYQLQSTDF